MEFSSLRDFKITMAEGGSGADDKQGECVNLLYLASNQRGKRDPTKSMKKADDTGLFSSSDDGDQSREAPKINRLNRPSSSASFDHDQITMCPRVNCPEKIIICLDVSQEMEKETFRSRAGDKFTPIKLVKRALGIFIHSKHRLNPKHEFALILLKEQAIWLVNFTNNPEKIIAILDNLHQCFSTESLDLSTLFDTIEQSVQLPKVTDPTLIPPPYTVRMLLIYGRSYCIPQLPSKETLKLLMLSPHFFCDALYIHEPPNEDNCCEAVFDILCELDQKGLFYINEVSRNPTKLYDCMAQMLPHPLQRPLQNDAAYKVEKPEVQ